VDVSREIFFLTVCAAHRGGSPLLPVATQLIGSLRAYHETERWWIHLCVVMPDHVHLLLRVPPEGSMPISVRLWKKWTARHLGIRWQRDFFDHRVRAEESLREKADYILQNPVRAGLVTDWIDWPHHWIGENLLILDR
jgi:REP element-mobilizing transposase RayT